MAFLAPQIMISIVEGMRPDFTERCTRPHRVSVVIPTKNRSKLLSEAIRSVGALEGPDLDLEIIVVDNGSTDDTAEVVSAFGARLLRCTKPGPAAARNVGIRVATGEYIAFLDDDDVWLPQHIRPELALLTSRPELAACIGQIVPTDASSRPLADPYPDDLPADGDAFQAFLSRWPQIGAVVVRASVRDTVGYLDEQLIAGEEWDWLLRIALRHRIGHVAIPGLLFRSRPVATRFEDDVNCVRLRFARRVFWRNVWRGRRRVGPVHVIRSALRFHGVYAGYFLRSGAERAASGERIAALKCLIRALSISPLHVGWAAVRRPSSLTWVARAVGPYRLRSARPPGVTDREG